MRTAFVLLLLAAGVQAETRQDRWAAILTEAPVAEQAGYDRLRAIRPGASEAQAVRHSQSSLRSAMRAVAVEPTGASSLLLNAVYFRGTARDAERVRALPGVKEVLRLEGYHRADAAAVNLVNATPAWNSFGGPANAGAGRRIGILDSGIDHTHPAFQDASLTPPAGFPRASRNDFLSFTNSKVIVARSYVEGLVGTDPRFTRPDDLTPRDRAGHGTAVAMLAAGVRVDGPAAAVSGVAPKAFLGNYKIFGSPGVNDVAFTDVIIRAIEDAIVDGMDVLTLSLGRVADYGPLDNCGNRPCDARASAIQDYVVGTAARMGIPIVVPAGNTGDLGFNLPSFGTIESPGTAPAAITVGATTNSNRYFQRVLPPQGAPINTFFGNGPEPAQPLTATAVNVRNVGDDGFACRPLGNGTLTGAIAVVLRGNCQRDQKVIFAQRAGAIAVVMINFEGTNGIFPMRDMANTGIPAALIGWSDGQRLLNQIGAGSAPITLNPSFTAVTATADEISFFSSTGPAIASFGIKPELVAPGVDLYAATQSFDPNGELFSASRYTGVSGTSFAVPLVAGAIALVKQRNPTWNALQLKSAVVNSAGSQAVTDFDSNGNAIRPARVTAAGAGKLDINAALGVTITANPSTISFGVADGTILARDLRLTNTTGQTVQLSVTVNPRDRDTLAQISITPATNFTLAPGATTQLTIRLGGQRPNPGQYEGFLEVTGSGTPLRIPYLYLAGDGVPYNIYAVKNDNFLATPRADFILGNDDGMLVKVLDRFGVPVRNAPVNWTVITGTGRVVEAENNSRTDIYGISAIGATLGPELGVQAFQASVAGLTQVFDGRVIPIPSIRGGGVVNAASGQVGQGLAPGSYISIFGVGLAEVTRVFSTPYLPLSLSNVSVSFDTTDGRNSFPGRLHFVSEGQINVQIPWELQGQNQALMKVSIGPNISSAVTTIPLAMASPGIFEYDDAGSGRRLAAALDQGFRVISGANPVARGSVVQLYANGLGRVDNPTPSGEVAPPAGPLSRTVAVPTVTIGGRPAEVLFSGLSPGSVGLYQLNVRVPEDVGSGVQSLQISISGVSSQTSQLPIQ